MSGADIAPLIVLVRPQMGENIGATARAMLNFGLKGLRLVAPRDGWPNPAAKAMAAGAAEVIDNARVFDTVVDAVSDCHLVLATTARHRGLFLPVHTPQVAAETLRTEAHAGRRTAILFGAEKSGLDSNEVAQAHGIINIPVNPSFSSLNLAQAVIVIAYEWSKAKGTQPLFESEYDDTPASMGEVDGMISHFIALLDQAGYFYPDHKRVVMERNVRTLLTNASMSSAETRLFRGMIRQLARMRAD
ncbi:RNA methyltransferase [Parvularcula sp. LCG005]|uniref:RNA methyltransferase n=1 Tax=Parvularcula sp. LCG005 TaxID=3078805 RepID=UPI002941D9E2|nr:RNA methyltransferase [Parvularcula sp. LCG005]WOI54267.1 RNA methyltransferase [Parvularcula sp. LCG005]